MRGAKKVTLAFVEKTNHSAFWQVDDVPRKFENFENILFLDKINFAVLRILDLFWIYQNFDENILLRWSTWLIIEIEI